MASTILDDVFKQNTSECIVLCHLCEFEHGIVEVSFPQNKQKYQVYVAKSVRLCSLQPLNELLAPITSVSLLFLNRGVHS